MPVKIFQKYDSQTRADRAASSRLGHVQRYALGEYFWIDDRIPGICFPTRKACLQAIERKERAAIASSGDSEQTQVLQSPPFAVNE